MDKEGRHTAGNWFVVKDTANLFNGCDLIISDQIEDAIICSMGHDVPEVEANGRMISCGPEMFSLLHEWAQFDGTPDQAKRLFLSTNQLLTKIGETP